MTDGPDTGAPIMPSPEVTEPVNAPAVTEGVPSVVPHVTVNTKVNVRIRRVGPDGKEISSTNLGPELSKRLLMTAVMGVGLLVILIAVYLLLIVR